MYTTIKLIETTIYNQLGFTISDYIEEKESQEYEASQFTLSDRKIINRTAKITPKKTGQFVTFYKRNIHGIIEPFDQKDAFDYYLVNIKTDEYLGQFVFPKSILIKKGILNTEKKEGKRAFRVYPPWGKVESKQATLTQKWQLDYFFNVNSKLNCERIRTLFEI